MMAVFIVCCQLQFPDFPNPGGRPVASHTASFGSLLTSLGSCLTNQRQYSQALVRVPRTNPYQLCPEEIGLTV